MCIRDRYDIRGKKILTTLDKYYLTDLGIGRIHNSGFKLEMGALLENVIYNELLNRGYEVYIGKVPNGEIDFVALKDGKKEYYQVAYYLYDQAVIDREFGEMCIRDRLQLMRQRKKNLPLPLRNWWSRKKTCLLYTSKTSGNRRYQKTDPKACVPRRVCSCRNHCADWIAPWKHK